MSEEELRLKVGVLQLQLDCAIAALRAIKKVRSVASDVRKTVDTALEAIDKIGS